MSNAEIWRSITERHLEELGFEKGQGQDALPEGLDPRWFKRFMGGQIERISRPEKELLIHAFAGNSIRRRKAGLPCSSLDLIYLSESELLEVYEIPINTEE